MASSRRIIDLRNLLAERFPQSFTARDARLVTSVAPLDEATGGGLPKGAITELISAHPSAGSATLISALLEAAHRGRYFMALIDGRDSFDACGPGEPGNARLRNLLWVRCHRTMEAIKAADLLLRDGNFPLVILDLVLNPAAELRKIPQTSWYRLQRLAEAVPSACLIINRQSMVSSAQLKIVLENSWTLADLENEHAILNLRFHVKRSHLKSAIRNPQSAIN